MQRLGALARKVTPIAVGVLITLIALTLFNILNPGPKPLTQKELDTHIAQVMASATPPPALSARVYAALQPSLVQVETKVLSTDGKEEGGRGAGVIIDENGQILTALHVVQNAIDVQVLFMDGTRSPATVVNTQPQNDIALLKPQQLPSQFTPAVLGNPKALNVGDEAFALGSPFGLTGSESAGIVSGLNRVYHPNKDTKMEGMIQFDAAVNPGNSGGPLVNRAGEVVGVVTGLLNPTDQNFFVGIGFAVPIDVAASSAGPNPF
jgi:S1-C subfamily serine protease